jgi:hypothetical protein
MGKALLAFSSQEARQSLPRTAAGKNFIKTVS